MKKLLPKTLKTKLAIAVLLLTVLSVVTASMLIRGKVEKNIELRATDEVDDAVEMVCGDIQKNLKSAFMALDTLSSYLSASDEPIDSHGTLMRSYVQTNGAEFIAMADTEGNVLRYEQAQKGIGGRPPEKIEGWSFFSSKLYGDGKHAVKYIPGEDGRAARLLLAVPVMENNVISGSLFAAYEQEKLENLIFNPGSHPGIDMALVNGEGVLLGGRLDNGKLKPGDSIFGGYLSDSSVTLMAETLKVSEGGSFQNFSDGEDGLLSKYRSRRFVGFRQVGAGDWIVVCSIDNSKAADLYDSNTKLITSMIYLVSLVFICAAAAMFILFIRSEKRSRMRTEESEEFSRKMSEFLTQSGSLSFDFDMRELKFTASPALEKYLRYPVPEDWFTVLPERSRLHPEFDYKTVVETYNEILVTGDYKELYTDLDIEDLGRRKLKVCLSVARRKDSREIYGLFGIVTDVTDQYRELLAEREEEAPFMTLEGEIPETIPGFMCKLMITETDLRFLEANRALLRFLHKDEENFRECSMTSQFAEEERQQVLAQYLQLKESKGDLHYYGHAYKDTGEEVWVNMEGRYAGERDGNPVYYCAVADITDIVRATRQMPADMIAGETAARENREEKPRVEIRTFGYFDVFVNNRPISFAHDKSKEMLAVLVDRRGGFVSTAELISYLWEDEESNRTTQSRCRQVASRLKHILEENGIADIIETDNGKRRIVPERVDCDLFNYLSDKPEYSQLFNGSYMMNYSWSEVTLADLESRRS